MGCQNMRDFPGKKEGAHQMSRNKQRSLTIVDVTRSRPAFCVAGAVAIKGTAFVRDLRRLNFVAQFFELLRGRAWTAWWDLTWRKDVLEAGERCADANHRRAGEGRADHDRRPPGATTQWDCGELRCRGTSRIIAATHRRRALAVGAVIRR
jgi:hypothetical protein